MAEEAERTRMEVGKVSHFFSKISVAAVELTDTLKVGDTILIEGATTHLEQTVDSMQIENKAVNEAKAGDAVGIKVKDRVRVGDKVYKLV